MEQTPESLAIDRRLMARRDLSAHHKLLLVWLWDQADASCVAAHPVIVAAGVGTSPRSAARWLDELERLGLLRIVDRRRGVRVVELADDVATVGGDRPRRAVYDPQMLLAFARDEPADPEQETSQEDNGGASGSETAAAMTCETVASGSEMPRSAVAGSERPREAMASSGSETTRVFASPRLERACRRLLRAGSEPVEFAERGPPKAAKSAADFVVRPTDDAMVGGETTKSAADFVASRSPPAEVAKSAENFVAPATVRPADPAVPLEEPRARTCARARSSRTSVSKFLNQDVDVDVGDVGDVGERGATVGFTSAASVATVGESIGRSAGGGAVDDVSPGCASATAASVAAGRSSGSSIGPARAARPASRVAGRSSEAGRLLAESAVGGTSHRVAADVRQTSPRRRHDERLPAGDLAGPLRSIAERAVCGPDVAARQQRVEQLVRWIRRQIGDRRLRVSPCLRAAWAVVDGTRFDQAELARLVAYCRTARHPGRCFVASLQRRFTELELDYHRRVG